MVSYDEFIASKRHTIKPAGFECGEINPKLFDWQQDVTRYLVKLGRGGCYANCGLGKSAIQLEYACHVVRHTGGKALILCPLAVANQTKREAEKFAIDVDVTVCRTSADVQSGINVTNYERIEKFDPSDFAAVILDESSILKSISGKIRSMVTEAFAKTPYRLCLSATPAPNDHMELGSQSEFLGVMSRSEMLSMFFVHDGGNTSQWRLKGHARDEFWKWMASWSVMIRTPSDLGYDDRGFDLPPLRHHEHIVESPTPEGRLFALDAVTLEDERAARKASLELRCEKAAEIAAATDNCVIWCNLNAEGDLLERLIPDAVQVAGSHSIEEKEERLKAFSQGDVKYLITKPKIGGFGLNWQHCDSTVIFPTHSWEAWYQMIRRFYRFGQNNEVNVHAVLSESEGRILANIKRKEQEYGVMIDGMVNAMAGMSAKNVRGTTHTTTNYNPSDEMEIPKWLTASTSRAAKRGTCTTETAAS